MTLHSDFVLFHLAGDILSVSNGAEISMAALGLLLGPLAAAEKSAEARCPP